MKKSPVLAAVVACLVVLALGAALAPAQRPGAVGPAPKPIALVNLSYIFKNHVRFQSEMKQLEAQMKEAEAQIEKEKGSIQQRREEMKGYEQGSPEFKNLEREITQRLGDLQVLVRQQRDDFLKRQGQIHYNTYQEVRKEIDYYARQNNIGAVLRFADERIDPDQPEEVIRQINKQVIWYSPTQDVTGIILERLNGPARSTNQAVDPRNQRLPFERR